MIVVRVDGRISGTVAGMWRLFLIQHNPCGISHGLCFSASASAPEMRGFSTSLASNGDRTALTVVQAVIEVSQD
jgi:hypothetical protein